MRLGVLLGFCLASASASADASPYLGRENPLATLLPSAAALRGEQRARVENQLATALLGLPDVARADVALELPADEQLPLDQPRPQPHVRVQLALSDAGPSDAQVLTLLAQGLPGLTPAQLQVVRSHAQRARAVEPAVRVGPFRVAPESASLLRAVLAACLGTNALLALLLLLGRRARAPRGHT